MKSLLDAFQSVSQTSEHVANTDKEIETMFNKEVHTPVIVDTMKKEEKKVKKVTFTPYQAELSKKLLDAFFTEDQESVEVEPNEDQIKAMKSLLATIPEEENGLGPIFSSGKYSNFIR